MENNKPYDWIMDKTKSIPVVDVLKCLKCKIDLKPVLCYSCPHEQCPSGMGSVYSLGRSHKIKNLCYTSIIATH
jgi:hypothetical protein